MLMGQYQTESTEVFRVLTRLGLDIMWDNHQHSRRAVDPYLYGR